MVKASWTITWVLPDGRREEGPAYRPLNLLAHAEMRDLGIPQACGGQAECGTCRIRLLSGTLSPKNADERLLMERFPRRFREQERLGCRARPRSDLCVEVIALRPHDLRQVDDESPEELPSPLQDK